MKSSSWVKIQTSTGNFVLTFDDEEIDDLCGRKATGNYALVRHFLLSWLSLLSDSPLNSSSLKPERVYRAFLKGIKAKTLIGSIKELSGLSHELISNCQLYGSGSLTGPWIEGFKDTPVFKEYLAFYRTGDPVLLQFLLSFLLFGKKLKYQTDEWHEIALRDWIDVEDGLRNRRFDDDKYTSILKVIVAHLIGTYTRGQPFPRFGTGRVSERGIADTIDKVSSLKWNLRLDSVLRRADRLNQNDVRFSIHQIPLGSDDGAGMRPLNIPSRLKFVPKDIFKSRSICMEPNAVMFVQQAVLRWVREAMDNGPMKQFCNLSDQTINQDAARYGSCTGDVDTIDLSSASDSVSFDLVRRIFPKEVLYDLAMTRSRDAILPDGSLRRLKKFAPMGSALCFPTQCIVFTSIAILSSMIHSGWLDNLAPPGRGGITPDDVKRFIERYFETSYGYIHPDHRSYQPLCVYGDDICIDSRLTHTLTTLLTHFGFKVNIGKSFLGSVAVRESCGVYCFAGYDVTPFRYSLPQREGFADAKFLASCIALANRANSLDFLNVRKFLLNSVLRSGNRKLPFLFTRRDDLPYGLHTYKAPRNDHLRLVTRFGVGPKGEQPEGSHCVDYQRSEVKCYMFKFDEKRDDPSGCLDPYLYLRWWANKADCGEETDSNEPVLHGVTSGTRLKRGWTPAS